MIQGVCEFGISDFARSYNLNDIFLLFFQSYNSVCACNYALKLAVALFENKIQVFKACYIIYVFFLIDCYTVVDFPHLLNKSTGLSNLDEYWLLFFF